jgi:hypothetical protein
MRRFIKTCDETEKNLWLSRAPMPSDNGRARKYEAEKLKDNDRWKIYITTE